MSASEFELIQRLEEQRHVIANLKRVIEALKQNAVLHEAQAVEHAVECMEEKLTHLPPKQCLSCTGSVCEPTYCNHCLSSAMRGSTINMLRD